jgi:Rrf2 family protein
MKFTRQEEIALLFASELAKHRDTFVPLSDIAQKHGISLLFLKNIARMLKKEGMVMSKEGLNGGYMLYKDPSEISAFQVMQAVHGTSKDAGIVKSNFSCPLHPSCMPQKIRHLISDAFMRYLSDVTIDQFIKGGKSI